MTGLAAEELSSPFQELEYKAGGLFNFGKYQGRILIQADDGIIAEHDAGTAVDLHTHLISGGQGIVQTRRPPIGLPQPFDQDTPLHGYDPAYPGLV